jgi:hypothetical protein
MFVRKLCVRNVNHQKVIIFQINYVKYLKLLAMQKFNLSDVQLKIYFALNKKNT